MPARSVILGMRSLIAAVMLVVFLLVAIERIYQAVRGVKEGRISYRARTFTVENHRGRFWVEVGSRAVHAVVCLGTAAFLGWLLMRGLE